MCLPDSPLTKAFTIINARQQSEYMKAVLGGVGYPIEEFGVVE
jgi:hypothetical protein